MQDSTDDIAEDLIRHTTEGCTELASNILKFKSIGVVISREFERYEDAEQLAKLLIDNNGHYHELCYNRYSKAMFEEALAAISQDNDSLNEGGFHRCDRINERVMPLDYLKYCILYL